MIERDKIVETIEKRGWLRKVAGEEDFDTAVNAVELMLKDRLGVLITGVPGVGKTKLCNALADAHSCRNKIFLGRPDAVRMFDSDYVEYYNTRLYMGHVMVDDVGAEPPSSEFGVRTEKFADFLVTWHSLRVDGMRLFLTTNLSQEELRGRYGGRVVSRLKELCVVLKLNGTDKRQWIVA